MTIPPLAPWHWRSLPLNGRTGSQIFEALFLPKPHELWTEQAIATLLESPAFPSKLEIRSGRSPLSRYSICAGAPRISHGFTYCWTPALGSVLPTLKQLVASTQNISQAVLPSLCGLPFTGGWLGWLGYDVAWEIEQLPSKNPDPLPFPVAYWYVPDCFAVLDHWDQTLWLAATHEPDLDRMTQGLQTLSTNGRVTEFQEQLYSKSKRLNASNSGHQLSIDFVSDQASYEAAVIQAKKYIQAGDIFQANLSLRFSSPTQSDSWSIYTALHHLNPSPFASYWHTPWGAMISCSPERLVQRQGDRAQSRPIAGTRPRGITPHHDQSLAHELRNNRKENAEHIMLVDLERNDLGRVCEWGSVVVDELLTIERYSHVMHLVSNVIGTVRSPYTSIDLVRALFPGGTITGCPKVRCMEIIEELEPVRRSLFYGSCGYLDWRGNLDLNILIRTLLYVPAPNSEKQSKPFSTVWGQIGAGIVADSEPRREWDESLSKAQAQIEALLMC